MIIAVNTIVFPGERPEGYNYFIYETFRRITKYHPEQQFIFFIDRSFDKDFITGPNIKTIISPAQHKYPLLWRLWFEVKLPAMLKKNKADVCIAMGGACSLTTKLPQGLFLPGLSFLRNASSKKRVGKYLQKASAAAVPSLSAKTIISAEFAMNARTIEVIHAAPGEIFQPQGHEEKEATRNKYTEGKEYFLYCGNIDPHNNMLGLLKAFSVFKKRQQAGMKLVLAGTVCSNYRSFIPDLKTYKYRDDVVLADQLSESDRAKIMSAAYALVFPSAAEGFAMPVLEAMRCRVPVIATTGPLIGEITNGAALYTGSGDHTAIADAMMRLYKDETLRAELIKKGSPIVSDHNWDSTATRVWELIVKAFT